MATDLVGVVTILGRLRRVDFSQVLEQRGLIGFHLYQEVITGRHDGFNCFFGNATHPG